MKQLLASGILARKFLVLIALGSALAFASTSAAQDSEVLKAKSHYQRLEVNPSASSDEIKKQYRRLIIQIHPDRNPVVTAEQRERMNSEVSALIEAYEELSKKEVRAAYDRVTEFGIHHEAWTALGVLDKKRYIEESKNSPLSPSKPSVNFTHSDILKKMLASSDQDRIGYLDSLSFLGPSTNPEFILSALDALRSFSTPELRSLWEKYLIATLFLFKRAKSIDVQMVSEKLRSILTDQPNEKEFALRVLAMEFTLFGFDFSESVTIFLNELEATNKKGPILGLLKNSRLATASPIQEVLKQYVDSDNVQLAMQADLVLRKTGSLDSEAGALNFLRFVHKYADHQAIGTGRHWSEMATSIVERPENAFDGLKLPATPEVRQLLNDIAIRIDRFSRLKIALIGQFHKLFYDDLTLLELARLSYHAPTSYAQYHDTIQKIWNPDLKNRSDAEYIELFKIFENPNQRGWDYVWLHIILKQPMLSPAASKALAKAFKGKKKALSRLSPARRQVVEAAFALSEVRANRRMRCVDLF